MHPNELELSAKDLIREGRKALKEQRIGLTDYIRILIAVWLPWEEVDMGEEYIEELSIPFCYSNAVENIAVQMNTGPSWAQDFVVYCIGQKGLLPKIYYAETENY